MSAQRLVVVMSGLPASGKSSLAVPLADALDAALLQQDAISEALFDVVGVRDRAWTRTLSRSALNTVVDLIAHTPRSVVDAWWPPGRSERLRPWVADLVEVRCQVPAGLAAERFARRVRHRGHHDDPAAAAAVDAMDSYVGLALPCPVVDVDTSVEVDLPALVDLIAGSRRG